MQKRLFHCSPEPKAAGMVESPERWEGPGRGGKLDRPLGEAEEGGARFAQGSRKRLGRWRLGVGPGGGRSIKVDWGRSGSCWQIRPHPIKSNQIKPEKAN